MTVNLASNPVAVEPLAATDPALQRFLQQLGTGPRDVNASRWMRLVLAKPTSTGGREGAPDVSATSATSATSAASGRAQRVVVRPLTLRGQECLNFVFSHATQDITKNLPWAEGLHKVQALLGAQFRNAHLFTVGEEIQLSLSKRGRGHLSSHAAEHPAQVEPAAAAHDREKRRWLTLDRPFLVALGVTTAQHQLVPAMARKWRQINKFLEVLDHALQLAGLLPGGGASGEIGADDTANTSEAPKAPLRVVDFGAGKAYLTFAVHDWLSQSLGQAAQVTGFELRADLVQQGNAAIALLGLQSLRMQQGDVRMAQPPAMDVMIALHACDVATDHAIHLGLRAGARVILCSPCCHKELRPQLLSPHPLRSVFQHGIHAEQTAEMVTDSLRALLLQAEGYETQVFEFVALEHTRKNKMILAVKRGTAAAPATVDVGPSDVKIQALAQMQELKLFFGVRQQCLETLLMAPSSAT